MHAAEIHHRPSIAKVTTARRLTIALVPSALVAGQVPAYVFPVLGQIAAIQQVSAATVTWVLTSAFVSSAVSTPIVGRFADLFGHRRVLLVSLVIVLAGSVISATTTDFAMFIVGRVLSGPASALYPLTSSTLQHHLPQRQMHRAITILSSCLGLGGAMALVVAGTLGGGDYRVIFWFPVAFTVLALALVVAGVPRAHDRQRGSVDLVGGVLLAAGIVMLLLPLSQAARWGLGSARSLGCIVGAIVLMLTFLRVERRVRSPMLPLQLLRRSLVVAVGASVLVGAMTFVPLVVVPILLQARPAIVNGGGLATPLVISLVYLLPGNVLGLAGTPIGSRLARRRGVRTAFAVVGLTGLAGAVLPVAAPAAPWALVAGMFLPSSALYVYYGALPAQVLPLVRRNDLGVANSLISLGRWVGAALATASASLVLSTSGPRDVLGEGDFRAALAVGVVVTVGICLAAGLLLRDRGVTTGPGGGVDGAGPTEALTALPPPVGDLTTDVVALEETTAGVAVEERVIP